MSIYLFVGGGETNEFGGNGICADGEDDGDGKRVYVAIPQVTSYERVAYFSFPTCVLCFMIGHLAQCT